MLKFINAPIGGGGSSPATIFCKYSRPDKPRPASARARGSSQLIVSVRASFPVAFIIPFPFVLASPSRSGALTKGSLALLQDRGHSFDKVRRMKARVLVDRFKVEGAGEVC